MRVYFKSLTRYASLGLHGGMDLCGLDGVLVWQPVSCCIEVHIKQQTCHVPMTDIMRESYQSLLTWVGFVFQVMFLDLRLTAHKSNHPGSEG